MNKILLGLLLGRARRHRRRFRMVHPGGPQPDGRDHHRLDESKDSSPGVAAGIFARKVNSVRSAFVSGSGSDSSSLPGGLPAARLHFEIILPGSIVGMIVGYATQRYGLTPAPAR